MRVTAEARVVDFFLLPSRQSISYAINRQDQKWLYLFSDPIYILGFICLWKTFRLLLYIFWFQEIENNFDMALIS